MLIASPGDSSPPLRKWKLKRSVLKMFILCHHKREGYLPLLCFSRPENLARQWETELRPCKSNICFPSRDIMACKRTKHNSCSVFGCTNENQSTLPVKSLDTFSQANVKVDSIKHVCEYTRCNASVVHVFVIWMACAISAFPLIETTMSVHLCKHHQGDQMRLNMLLFYLLAPGIYTKS